MGNGCLYLMYVKAVFERVMMPHPHQHLVVKAGVVEPAAEAHPIRYLCDSFVRLKRKSRADQVWYNYTDTLMHTTSQFNSSFLAEPQLVGGPFNTAG